MSLEVVELITEIEGRFEIYFTDQAAEKILTVGQCHDYIIAQLDEHSSLTDDAGCLSSNVFYRLRRALMQEFSVARSAIHPADALNSLIPVQNRKCSWQRLADAAASQLPPLERPSWVGLIITILATVGSITFLVSAAQLNWTIAGIGLVGILLAIICWLVSATLAVCIPATCQTMRSAVTTIIGENLPQLRATNTKWNRQDAWIVLVALIVKHLEVRPEDVKPETNFIRDLGCD